MEEFSIFKNQLTLRIFLLLRFNEKQTLGVRMMQRSISVKSTSTVLWHLDKLIDERRRYDFVCRWIVLK